MCEKVLSVLTSNQVKILRNQKLSWPDWLREFDIIYSFEQYWHTYTHFVECKDYNRNVDVTRIWEFINKCNDFNEQKISRKIFITWKWFSSSALSKAKREWIECWTINEFLNSKNIELTVPVVISEIIGINVHIDWFFNSWNKSRKIPTSIDHISDVSTETILWKLKDRVIQEKNTKLVFTWIDCWLTELFIRDTDGDRLDIFNFELKFTVIKKFYLWQLSDVPSTYLIDDKIESKKTLIIDPQQILINYKNFEQYNNIESVSIWINSLKITLDIIPVLNFSPSLNISSLTKV